MSRTAALMGAMLLVAAGIGIAVWGPHGRRDGPSDGALTARPNFVIIDIDTLSAGHAGSVREGVAVTPTIDALARRGVSFTAAFSQSGWTMPAVTSLLTGRWPIPTRPDGQGAVSWREQGARDVAEILAFYGYTTAVFWGRTLPGSVRFAATGTFDVERSGQDLPNGEVTSWLDGAPPEPFFLLVHEVDLHHPTTQPNFDGALPFVDPSIEVPVAAYDQVYSGLAARLGADAAEATVRALYDANLNLYDRKVGQIVASLERSGLAGRTIVIVTADHGEDMLEHAVFDHGQLYDSVLHVPLVIVDPATPHPGRIVDTVVQTIDIAPTILARAGVPVDEDMDGQSLLPLVGIAEGTVDARPVYSMTNGCSVSIRRDGLKLIVTDRRLDWPRASERSPAEPLSLAAFLDARGRSDLVVPDCAGESATMVDFGGARPGARADRPRRLKRGGAIGGQPGGELAVELYDLAADPGERHDLAAARPDVVERLLGELLTWAAARAEAGRGAMREPVSAEQQQALRDQGYWGLVEPE